MSTRISIDAAWIDENVLQNPETIRKLEEGAARLAPIVRRIAAKEGDAQYAQSVRVVRGRRPGTKSPTGIRRPYTRVIVGDETADAKEYGGRLPKKGFLRRAVAQWEV